MKKRFFAILLCLIMVLPMLPVTATAAHVPKTYTFTPTESWEGKLEDYVYFKGDTIVFVAEENEPFSSTQHGACHSPTVGVSFTGLAESGSVTGGICSVNTYSRDGSGCMVSFTITSDDAVTLSYYGAGPTGVQSPPLPRESGENYYAYRYHLWGFETHPVNKVIDYDLGEYGVWQSGASYPTSVVVDGSSDTITFKLPSPQSNDSTRCFDCWSYRENTKIVEVTEISYYAVNGMTDVTLTIMPKYPGGRTGDPGITFLAEWVSSSYRLPSPTFSYDAASKSVSISCPSPYPGVSTVIYYTTDGSIPIDNGDVYTGPIEISAATEITAVAYLSGRWDYRSDIVSETFTPSAAPVEPVAAPTFGTAAGTYNSTQSVTLSCATPGATIRYTTNGDDPTESSAVYSSPIFVSATATIKAKAFKTGMNASAVASATYRIVAPLPVETVATPTFGFIFADTYTSAQSATLSCATPGATIRYTTNGTEPTESSAVYSSPISVSATTTIKAKAFKDGMYASAVASKTYAIDTVSVAPVETVATPTFGIAAGTYTSAQNVAISCTTDGATIFYTTNGDDPAVNGSVYGRSIYINSTTTVKAIAVKDGMTASAVASATYTINTAQPPSQTVATPTFGIAAGQYFSTRNVDLLCVTTGATIRYTTNGDDPTESSPVYSSPIFVSETTTVKARAFKTGMNASAVASATYTIDLQPIEVSSSSGAASTPTPPVPSAPSAPSAVIPESAPATSAVSLPAAPDDDNVRMTPPVMINKADVNESFSLWVAGYVFYSADSLIVAEGSFGDPGFMKGMLDRIAPADVFSLLNISFESGKKSTGSEMQLVFDLNTKYAGQDFTLVHQKADATYEYFYDNSDLNGDLSFGPLYELSPFMLVKGTLEPASSENNSETDGLQLLLWLGAAILVGGGVTAFLVIRQRKRKNG